MGRAKESAMMDQGTVVRRDPQIRRAPAGTGLYDVLDLILDKGLVIDAFVRVSLVGIELVTVDLRVVIASVDTYLRYAAAAENLQLYNRGGEKSLPNMVSGMKKAQFGDKAMGMLERGEKALESKITGRNKGQDRDEEDRGQDEGIAGTLTRGVKNVVGRVVDTFTGSDDDEDEGQQDEGQQDEEKNGGEARRSEPGREERRGDRDRGKRDRGDANRGKPTKASARR
jgi:hypothetical protein